LLVNGKRNVAEGDKDSSGGHNAALFIEEHCLTAFQVPLSFDLMVPPLKQL
jgi:hypothetical protein